MTPRELLAIFREEVFDTQAPYLWSDNLILGYISEAQKQFCRDTYGIPDARSFKIAIKADGTEWYKIDPRIIKVRGATLSDTGRPIAMVPSEKTQAYGILFDGKQGPVKTLVTGLENNTVRVHPVPNVAATISLTTFRITDDVGADDDLEIELQHQRGLLHWTKHLAYSVQDTETYDKQAAEKYEGKHKTLCDKVIREQSRVAKEAGTVVYGGI